MNNKLKTKIDNDLLNAYKNGPKSLFEIYKYVFSAKGKRIRPILTLLTSKSLYGEYNKSYQAAIAIAAGCKSEHPFLAKYRLFSNGRWPLSIIKGYFYIF